VPDVFCRATEGGVKTTIFFRDEQVSKRGKSWGGAWGRHDKGKGGAHGTLRRLTRRKGRKRTIRTNPNSRGGEKNEEREKVRHWGSRETTTRVFLKERKGKEGGKKKSFFRSTRKKRKKKLKW